MKKNLFNGLLETILVTYVSASMFLYGAFKYVQFGYKKEPYADQVVGDLSGMELMWAFYGRTLTFPVIIGIFELIGAGLLFFRRTRVLGCLLLTGILINVIIQDVIFGVLGGAILSAAIYQLMVFYILWKNRVALKSALKLLIIGKESNRMRWVIHVAIGLIISVFIKVTIGL